MDEVESLREGNRLADQPSCAARTHKLLNNRRMQRRRDRAHVSKIILYRRRIAKMKLNLFEEV